MRADVLLVLPVLLPMVTAVSCLLFSKNDTLRRALSLLGSLGLFLATVFLLVTVGKDGILVSHVGGWRAPFGIAFVADPFAAIMVFITGFLGFCVCLYHLGLVEKKDEPAACQTLYHLLLMGICGAFLTGDYFNLYVWFEVLLMASFALLTVENRRPQLEGAIRYVLINLLGSALFLAGAGLLYSVTGTLNMADAALYARATGGGGLMPVILFLFLIAFGTKAAIFPLFFWLPPAYPVAMPSISAIFAGLLTKVGVYAVIRTVTLFLPIELPRTHELLLGLSLLTMITGVLGAAAQSELRRILSFHIISQVGYMIFGLALNTRLAAAGAIFYIIHHIVVKANLFLTAGVVEKLRGTGKLPHLGGIALSHPWLALAFSVAALSLAGLPPLSGFWAKLILVKAAISVENYIAAATALGVGLLTLFSMIKIWGEVFWKEASPSHEPSMSSVGIPNKFAVACAIFLLTLWTVGMGLFADSAMKFSLSVADSLMDPAPYFRAVLGKEVVS